jgi:hypothetical protein
VPTAEVTVRVWWSGATTEEEAGLSDVDSGGGEETGMSSVDGGRGHRRSRERESDMDLESFGMKSETTRGRLIFGSKIS